MESRQFDYGFMSMADGVLRPNVNSFYGPWSYEAFTNGTIVNEITKELGIAESQIPAGLTIAVEKEAGCPKEYWWYKNGDFSMGWTQKITESGGGSDVPVQLATQVYASNNFFSVPTNANGECDNEVLKRATRTSISVIYKGKQLEQDPGDAFQLQLLQDGNTYKLTYGYDVARGCYIAFLEFNEGAGMHTVVDAALTITYSYESTSGLLPMSIQSSKSSLAYMIQISPESLYIPSSGVIPELFIDVDAIDPYNDEKHDIPATARVRAYYSHVENDKYVKSPITLTEQGSDKGLYKFGPQSEITLGGANYTLQAVYNDVAYNEKYFKTGEVIRVVVSDNNIDVKSQEIRIVRESAVVGPGFNQYDISLTDEYITMPEMWFGAGKDEVIKNNIKMRTATEPDVRGIGNVSNVRITNIACTNDSSLLAIVEGHDDMPFADAKNGSYKIIGYRFQELISDDTVNVSVSFQMDGKEYSGNVQQIITSVKSVNGETYDLLCSTTALGVDKNDENETSTYSVKFYVNKNINGKIEQVAFTNDTTVYGKGMTIGLSSGVHVQFLDAITSNAIVGSGIQNMKLTLGNSNKELTLTFDVDESKFTNYSLQFCLWIEGQIHDYGNVGMYVNPKDGSQYVLNLSYDSFPVDSLGRMLPTQEPLQVSLTRLYAGKATKLKGASPNKTLTGYANLDNHDYDFYFGYYSYGSPIACGTDFKDYSTNDASANGTLTISEDKLTFSYNVYKNKHKVFGSQNITTGPDGAVSLINKGFNLSVYCLVNGKPTLVATKTITAILPGQKGDKGDKGDDGKPGKDGNNGSPGLPGSQIRFLGEWNVTKRYCYQSQYNGVETWNEAKKEWEYTIDGHEANGWNTTGLMYIDVVTYEKKYYQAVANSMGENPKTSGGYWQQADQFGALITETMIANAIDANGISAREILLKYDGNVSHGYIGGMCDSESETFKEPGTKEDNLVLWVGDYQMTDGEKTGVGGAAGGTVGKNAAFKVYADGRVVCSGVDSKINGLATSTSEVRINVVDLEKNTDSSGNVWYYFNFTKYGPNVLIYDTRTENQNKESLVIDMPAYLYKQEPWSNGESGLVIQDTFSNRGLTTTDEVSQYIRFVNQYRTTNVRIRCSNLKCGGGVFLRGGLAYDTTAMTKYDDFDVDLRISHSDLLRHSMTVESIDKYFNMWGVNIKDEDKTDSNNNTYIFTVLPNRRYDKENNSGKIETFYDMARVTTGGFGDYQPGDDATTDYTNSNFDISFVPHSLTIEDQKVLNDLTASSSNSYYFGMFWISENIIRCLKQEGEIISTVGASTLPGSYDKFNPGL